MNKLNKFILIPFIVLILVSIGWAQQEKNIQQRLNQMFNMARIFEQRAQFSRALEIYQRLWNDFPTNINYYRGVKNNLINLRKFKQAEEAIKKMLRMNSSVLIKVDLGDLYFKKGEKEKAILYWNQIVEKNKQNPSTFQIVASAMTQNFLYDEALEIYQKGREKLNNKSLFLIEMARLYKSRRDHKNAVLLYLEYLKYYPSQYTFVEHSITSFASDPELANEIEEILLTMINKEHRNIQLRNILAAFYIRSSNYRAALEEYSIIDQYIVTRSKKEKDKVGRELFRFAQNAFNDGAYEYAIQAYDLVLSRYPKSQFAPNSKYGSATAYEKLGQFEKAIIIYKQIQTEYPNTPHAKNSNLRIGEIQLENFSDPVAAEKSFKKIMESRPFDNQNIEAIFRIGDCYLACNLLDEAAKPYDQILHQRSASHHFKMKALLKLGKIFYWQGDFKSALEQFQKIQTDPINITNEQAGIYVNDALEYSMLIDENKNSENMLKQFALADLLTEQKKYEQALKLCKQVTQQDSSKNLLDDAWLKIGQLCFRLQKYNESIEAYQNIIDKHPESVYADLAQKKIGDGYDVGLKNSASALKAYELVLANYPDSIYLEEVRKKIRELEKRVL